MAALPCVLIFLFSDAVSVYLLGDARTQLGLLLLLPCLLLTGIENIQKNYFYGISSVKPPAITELCEQLLRTGLVLFLLWRFPYVNAEQTVALIVWGMFLCEVSAALTQTVLFRLGLSRSPLGTLVLTDRWRWG